MSFSSEIKNELAAIRLPSGGEREALLSALTHTAASMKLGRGVSIEYVSESKSVAGIIERLVREKPGMEATVSVREQEGLKLRSNVVSVTGAGCEGFLRACGCLPGEGQEGFEPGRIPEGIVGSEAAQRAFIRGAFLGGGSISDPTKGYHLEFVSRYASFADSLSELLRKMDMNPRIVERKSNFVVYFKDGESIADFLKLTGATEGLLRFEDIRLLRFTTNDLNRKTNFEEANMQKAALAAAQQLRAIETIRLEAGLDSLPPPLRQTAEARLNNPEATLKELSDELEIGKSGVKHRLARIERIAEDIRLHGADARPGEGKQE